MAIYRNPNNSNKLINAKSNFDCNINYFSGRQIGSYIDISKVNYWLPSMMYGTANGNVKVASLPLIRVYSTTASSFNSQPTLGIGDGYFTFIADNTESSPYRDIVINIPTGTATGTAYNVVSPAPPDSLYNYDVVFCNTGTTSNISVQVYGTEENFGGSTRYVIIASIGININTTDDVVIPGLYINGDAMITASNNRRIGDTLTNLYIRIREVN